jgi:hypothetical protein
MNIIFTSLLSILFALNTFLSIPFQEVKSAFEQGNADKIIALGTTKMLISIKGKEGVYSKSQGKQVLKGFFTDYPPQSFSFRFRGEDKGTSSFAVGDYSSSIPFRISLKFKKSGNNHLIESVTIAAHE